MHYADQVGLKVVKETLERIQALPPRVGSALERIATWTAALLQTLTDDTFNQQD